MAASVVPRPGPLPGRRRSAWRRSSTISAVASATPSSSLSISSPSVGVALASSLWPHPADDATGESSGRHRHLAVSRVLRSAPDPPQTQRSGILGGMADQVMTGRFVGRTEELARLRELLAHAADG